MTTEVELRSFISQEKYNELLAFFTANATFKHRSDQETIYFTGDKDLRIQRNDNYAKIWLKKGKMHDDTREEIEIRADNTYFGEMQKLFLYLGYEEKIKWLRHREEFIWGDITVCLDYTKGYGYIIELEILSDDANCEPNKELLARKFRELDIVITSKDDFSKAFEYYQNNWRSLIG